LDCVGSAPGNPQVCFLKQFGNECCLFANICERWPFVCGGISLTNVVVGRPMVGGLCVWTGTPLLDRMSSSSSLYLSSFKRYVFSLLYRLLLHYLCWGGWFEVYGMIVAVNVGFLCMEITQLVGGGSVDCGV